MEGKDGDKMMGRGGEGGEAKRRGGKCREGDGREMM